MPKRHKSTRATSSRNWLISVAVAAMFVPALTAAGVSSKERPAVTPGRHDAMGDTTVGEVRFGRPEALAVDPAGNLFVVDSELQVVRRISSDGRVVTVADLAPESTSPG